ncbi:MAG: J domain-containing protein [Deltaproteobacteria bacterium]|nr:J domain-containing protein [Deltaproteobacteria bacterium]
MSIRSRLIEAAKANLNALLERAADVVDPRRVIASLSDEDLEMELRRRKLAQAERERVQEAKTRVDAPPAGPSANGIPKDRAERERIARERVEKVRAAQAARERASSGPSGGSRGSRGARERREPSPGTSGPRARRVGNLRYDSELAKYFAVLEIPYGSDFDAVKSAYRKLMRKYHPDLHASAPEKLKAATEVSQALTNAYNELERVLMGGPNRR